jgi:hypothetical protein
MKLFITTILSAGLCIQLNAQTLQLAPLYNGAELIKNAATLIHDYSKPLQITPVSNFKKYLPALTKRYVQAPYMEYPFSFLKFEVERQDDASVKLVFETANEYNSHQFTIERVLLPGSEFQDIAQTTDTCYELLMSQNKLTGLAGKDSLFAKNAGPRKLSYNLTDNNNFEGISFYRITETENDSTANLTEIKAVPGKILKESFVAYPNPTHGNAQLQIFSKYAGASTLRILNMQGNVVKLEPVNLLKGNNNIPLNCVNMSNGIYHIEILRDQRTALITKIIKL